MNNSLKYEIAMSEVLYYLKGIRKEDIDKIPPKLISFFKENASKNYKCNFDYDKPLNELKLQKETKGLISMICFNYWCETDEQKKNFIKKLNENERKYQEELKEKYNPNNLFENKTISSTAQISNNPVVDEKSMVEYKESIFGRIKSWLKSLFINGK